MENTKSLWESGGDRSMRKWPFLWLRAHAKFITGGRFYFVVGRHDGHRKKSSSNDSSVAGYSASIPAWGQRRATGQEDAGVEGDVGRSIWKELLQDGHPPAEGRGCLPAACAAPGQDLVLSPTFAALQPCQDEETKLRFTAVNGLDFPRPVYSHSVLHLLTYAQQGQLSFGAVVANGAPLVSRVGWFSGGDTGRLSLQTRMRCPLLPPLPGEWVTSASPTLCGRALRLLRFFEKAF